MSRYFKFVAIRKDEEDWMTKELQEGRARFGWSSAGSDLRVIKAKSSSARTANEKIVWRYTQFLINKLTKGDRLIIQLSRPLRKFLIAEVTGEYHSTDPQESDFNHYIECKLLTEAFINVESQAVSQSLRHHISKRGHYYEIYEELAKEELDWILEKSLQRDAEFLKANEIEHTADYESKVLEEDVITQTYKRISTKWPSAYFEKFVADLIRSTPGLEVKKQGDSRQGWDLTMRILDPIDGSILHDNIPVQCKNYNGAVKTKRPIDDLERCIRNSGSSIAYLFIIGDLTKEFEDEFDNRLELLQTENEHIKLKVIGQEQIAKMYLNRVGSGI
jgi:hypothetical protein